MEENSRPGSQRNVDRYFGYTDQRIEDAGPASFIDVPQAPYAFTYPSRSPSLPTPISTQVMVTDFASTPQTNQSAQPSRAGSQATRATRSKYGALDWTKHKETLRRLYLDENKSLPEIMRIMKEENSFDASQKLYKDKFKIWEWNKNLPIAHAYFMADKARKRKRQDGKDTVFSFGGQQWTQERAESTVVRYSTRTKKARPEDYVEDGPTPMGVSYKTPKTLDASHNDAATTQSDREVDIAQEPDVTSHQDPGFVAGPSDRGLGGHPSPDETSSSSSDVDSNEDNSDTGMHDRRVESISLRWNGRDRSDLHALERLAKTRSEERDWVAAERLFRECWEGLSHILGSTHEDTVKIACGLAEMFAENKHMKEADAVLETTISNYINRLGFDHKRTQAHLLYSVELLNGWDRTEDAGALLAAALSCKEAVGDRSTPRDHFLNSSRKKRTRRTLTPAADASQRELTLAHLYDMLKENPTPADLDSGLRMARVHVAVKDSSIEELLKAFVKQCQRDPYRFSIQHLRARSQLLSYYDKTEQIDQHEAEFADAKVVCTKAWNSFNWVGANFACVEMLEAGLELAASFYKCGYEVEAADIFSRARDRCLQTFGIGDERTIWTQISIGMIYQTYADSWIEAFEWFQEAYSGALGHSSWGHQDGVTISLATALEKRHFAYISDEGRPFKSIFGVTGFTIRPGRLHLD